MSYPTDLGYIFTKQSTEHSKTVHNISFNKHTTTPNCSHLTLSKVSKANQGGGGAPLQLTVLGKLDIHTSKNETKSVSLTEHKYYFQMVSMALLCEMWKLLEKAYIQHRHRQEHATKDSNNTGRNLKNWKAELHKNKELLPSKENDWKGEDGLQNGRKPTPAIQRKRGWSLEYIKDTQKINPTTQPTNELSRQSLREETWVTRKHLKTWPTSFTTGVGQN